MESIDIPDNVTSIGECAFKFCRTLRSVTIPNSVTRIGDEAFEGCSSLTSIDIPDSVTSIGNCAFSFCESLTSITISKSVVTIIGNPFSGWTGVLHNESKAFIYEDNVLFNNDKTTIIAYRAKETDYIIPDSVVDVGVHAFGCSSLKSINIPDSVTSIGEGAFESCYSLKDITIPNSITSIGDCTFGDCDNLNTQIKAEIKRRFGEKVFNWI